jgi:tripartite-type tricarboxylate transporter receptor subunit TctC
MEKYLPGSTFIVKNVPGAGHIIGTNEIYASKPDGMTFGDFNKGLVSNQLVGTKGVKFDLGKMSWLGSAASEGMVMFVSKKAPFKNIKDVMKGDKEVIMAGSGIGAINHTFALLLKHMGVIPKLRVLTGYPSGEVAMAMMRGDLHAVILSYGTLKPMVHSGDIFPILGVGEDSDLSKEWPNVPFTRDIVPDPKKHAALLDFMDVLQVLGRPFAGPPNIPKDRLQILRQAFEKTLQDPKVLEIAKKAEMPIHFISGEKAEKLIKGSLQQPPELIQLLKEIGVGG